MVSSAKSLMLLLMVSGMSFMYMRKRHVLGLSPKGYQTGLGKNQNVPHHGPCSEICLTGMIESM